MEGINFRQDETFAQAINRAIDDSMCNDSKILCFGLGVTDPKGIFGTTIGLEHKHGSDRVFDIPCSENGITGIGIGASLLGYKPIMIHQRLDFFLLAMDQLVNTAAKWHYMFGKDNSVPITIRLILGRGWGQGPTHSQNLQAWFAHIPGLKVVSPSTPSDAYGLLLSSINDPNPVIFLEHRWLFNSTSVPNNTNKLVEIGKANVKKKGSDITIVASSYLTHEALSAAIVLENEYGISSEIIDLRTIKPIDYVTILSSVHKTKRILCIDPGSSSFCMSNEILVKVAEKIDLRELEYLGKLGMPDFPEPTSYALTKGFYNDANDIVKKVTEAFNIDFKKNKLTNISRWHDVPGDWFNGPF